jgi:hypothetical protein
MAVDFFLFANSGLLTEDRLITIILLSIRIREDLALGNG